MRNIIIGKNPIMIFKYLFKTMLAALSLSLFMRKLLYLLLIPFAALSHKSPTIFLHKRA